MLGHVSVVKQLIHSRANINAKTASQRALWHLAASHGHEDLMKYLWSHGIDPDDRTIEGYSCLHVAAAVRYPKAPSTFKRLVLDYGCEINEAVYGTGETVLHVACLAGRIEHLKPLVNLKADVEALDARGYSPLHASVENEIESVIERLLDLKANIDAVTPEFMTPFHIAVIHERKEMMHLLLHRGADFSAVAKRDFTALHLATYFGRVEMIKDLVHIGFHVDVLADGSTSLHVACVQGRFDCVKILLELGAEIEYRDGTGQTPRQLANAALHHNIANFLMELEVSNLH